MGYIAPPLCALCGTPQPFSLPDGICQRCQYWPPTPYPIRAVCRYTDISRQLIIGLKHAGKLDRAPFLAHMMAQSAADLIQSNMLVVPIPLHPMRYLYRSYNQSAEIARHLIPFYPSELHFSPNLLIRKNHTASMSGKNRKQRMRNVQNAFAIGNKPPADWQQSPILLLDDVMTTGATLQACADCLTSAGHQARISALVFARVFS